MKCINCGTEFNEGIFCPECGHKYDEEEIARIEREKKEREAREIAEKAEREAKEKAEREAREKAENERLLRERQEREERQRAEEELLSRTFNGKVYADKEEADLAKMESNQVEALKQRLLSTKKQDERRKIIAEFGDAPKTEESRARYEALKAKSEQEKPKSIIINWIYGITVLIAFIPAVTLSVENGAVYYIAMAWAGCGFYIWIIWKIVLFIKSKSKKYYLNIKHI
jgi:predicted  nucleic acid-binding Zn-ribbon protein